MLSLDMPLAFPCKQIWDLCSCHQLWQSDLSVHQPLATKSLSRRYFSLSFFSALLKWRDIWSEHQLILHNIKYAKIYIKLITWKGVGDGTYPTTSLSNVIVSRVEASQFISSHLPITTKSFSIWQFEAITNGIFLWNGWRRWAGIDRCCTGVATTVKITQKSPEDFWRRKASLLLLMLK